MKNLYYSFRKRTQKCSPSFIDMLDKVAHIISPYVKLDAEAHECTVISYFGDANLFVAYPPSALGEVKFITYSQPFVNYATGIVHLGIDGTYPRCFTLTNGVLYIGRSTHQPE